MFSYVLAFFLIYLFYRFVVGFVIPIYNASKKIKAKMQDVNQQYPPGYRQGSGSTPKKPGYDPSTTSTTSGKDYIEFEEIK